MPVFDIFKKKKTKKGKEKVKEKLAEKPEAEEKREKIKGAKERIEEKISAKAPVSSVEKPRKKEVKVAPLVLEAPHITEKATRLAEGNQYVFKVSPRANKQEIKKAIEEIYGVEVLKVRTIRIPKKERRLGRSLGWRKGYRKAIVKIKEGQSIEILPR